MTSTIEHPFSCPHCFERINTKVNLLVNARTCIEPCELCGKPIKISYSIRNNQVAVFNATPENTGL